MEFTLNDNHVMGVLAQAGLASAGQLLPLLIGFFSFGRLGWIIYKDYKGKTKEERKASINSLERSLGQGKWKKMFSLKLRKKKPGHLMYDLLTHWMPWLNCFPSWKRMRTPTFSSLDAESAPTTPRTPSVEKQEHHAVAKS